MEGNENTSGPRDCEINIFLFLLLLMLNSSSLNKIINYYFLSLQSIVLFHPLTLNNNKQISPLNNDGHDLHGTEEVYL